MCVRSHCIRGLTMVELLVALAILAFTLGGVVSIFFAGTRLGMRAQDEAEAGRIASAVYAFLDGGDCVANGWCGRNRDVSSTDNGKVFPGTLLSSQAASLVVDSTRTDNKGAQVRFPVVWQAIVSDPIRLDECVDVFSVRISVFADEDASDSVDVDDRLVGTFHSLFASRVTP